MAVPKRRTSKSKSKSRKANWKHKAYFKSKKAFSLAKSLLNGKTGSFIYIENNNLNENNT
uniref:ribosomal protein L32 n=1 Tax=Hypnea nidulans TaxID=673449 RepID=UPI0027DA37A6|nr:ribosomal protein L32 [Hypnea nidulans]WCH54448.1 ribosomal protein L32 [Hypnea nidulans]